MVGAAAAVDAADEGLRVPHQKAQAGRPGYPSAINAL
jgi:hypothetical protein